MTLPYLLAGPILRRATEQEIWIWLAFSKDPLSDFGIEAELYHSTRRPSEYTLVEQEACEGAVGATYFGDSDKVVLALQPLENLHLLFLRVVPAPKTKFALDSPLCFEVFLTESVTSGAKKRKLRYPLHEHWFKYSRESWRLGSVREPIALRDYTSSTSPSSGNVMLEFRRDWLARSIETSKDKAPLPQFKLRPKSSALIWLGSCFKLHGPGIGAISNILKFDGPQAAGLLVECMVSADGENSGWPHQLFLVGDQIYADDVSFILFEGVKQLATLLSTKDSLYQLPGKVKRDVRTMSANTRHAVVRRDNDEKTPFSLEDEIQNQLFALPEFCAYYLMHLNAAMWPNLNSALAAARTSDAIKSQNSHRLAEEIDRLIAAQREVHSLSRTVQSIPLYTMCDDHEVSDDFLIDADWKTALKATIADGNACANVTQFIVGNALHAYGAFQGVGNDPSRFFKTFVSATTDKSPVSDLLKIDWSFALETVPPTIFLDARTQREAATNDGTADIPMAKYILDYRRRNLPPAAQISKLALRVSVPFNLQMYRDAKLRELVPSSSDGMIILVTGAPVVWNERVEQKKPPWRDAKGNDSELWGTNPSNYLQLAQTLISMGIRTCICLGGDVHYGYARTATVARLAANAGTNGKTSEIKLMQIVSSPLLNRFEATFGDAGFAISEFATYYGVTKSFSADETITNRYSYEQTYSAWEIETAKHYSAKDSKYVFTEIVTNGINKLTAKKGAGIDKPVTSNHFAEICIDSSGIRSLEFHVSKDQAILATPVARRSLRDR